MGYRKDLKGQKINKLLVLEFFENKNKRTYWKCLCDCGNIKEILGTHLVQGKTKSCGCYNSEKASQSCKNRTIIPNKRIMYIWQSMKQRCYKEDSISYKNYGAKGIKICNEWLNNPKVFYDWAINNGYEERLTIDRINNNGDYEPNNCRWTDWETQMRNTKHNIIINYQGETNCVKYFIDKYKLNQFAIYSRLKRNWSVKDAIEKPVKERRRK